MTKETELSLRKALVIGHLCTTVPAILIGAMAVGLFLWRPFETTADLVRGGVAMGVASLCWVWGSIVTPRWRGWALRSGVDPDELYRWGRRNLLVSGKDSFFEKTEIHLSNQAFYGLLGTLLVLVFLTTETLLGEYLETRLAWPGVLGSLVGAGISAAVILPIHHSLRRLLKRSEERAAQLQPPDEGR